MTDLVLTYEIAVELGWTEVECNNHGDLIGFPPDPEMTVTAENKPHFRPPNFATDANASFDYVLAEVKKRGWMWQMGMHSVLIIGDHGESSRKHYTDTAEDVARAIGRAFVELCGKEKGNSG